MTSRQRLPDRRRGESFEFYHCNLGFTATIGRYRDGRIGELFINSHKSSGDLEALARDAAIIVSIALQHGADLGTIRRALTRDGNDDPATLIGAALDAIDGGRA
jgi:streptomycin 6-kinase